MRVFKLKAGVCSRLIPVNFIRTIGRIVIVAFEKIIITDREKVALKRRTNNHFSAWVNLTDKLLKHILWYRLKSILIDLLRQSVALDQIVAEDSEGTLFSIFRVESDR